MIDWRLLCGPRAVQGMSNGDEGPEAAPSLRGYGAIQGGQASPGVQAELAKLEIVRRIGLPADSLGQALPHELERYRRRVAVEAPERAAPTSGSGAVHLARGLRASSRARADG